MEHRKVLWIVAALWMPAAARAEVLWQSGFETDNLSEWSGKLNPDKNGTRQNIVVVDGPVHSGAHAAELTVHPDDLWPGNNHNRVELHQDGQRTKEGETTYFSWYFMLHADAKVHDDIGYWETANSYQQSMALYVDPSAGGTTLGFRTNRPAGKEHFKVPVTAQAWHQLTMQILWSTDAAKGRVSIWLDGKVIADEIAAQTKPDGNDLFIQVGFHRNASESAVETISIDDAVEGTSLTDVLMPLSSDAPDAGAPDPGDESEPGDAGLNNPANTDGGANAPSDPPSSNDPTPSPDATPGGSQGAPDAKGDDPSGGLSGDGEPNEVSDAPITGTCQVAHADNSRLTIYALLSFAFLARLRRRAGRHALQPQRRA